VHNPPPRCNDGSNESNLSIFRGQLGSTSGSTTKTLIHEEWRQIILYVLTNLEEVMPYMENFFMNSDVDQGTQLHRNMIPFLERVREMDCSISFHGSNIRYVLSLSFKVALTCEYYNNLACLNLQGQRDPSMSVKLRQVANGFAYMVRKYFGYDVNGYHFHTTSYDQSRPNQKNHMF
jgi:hypothetical protein